MIFTTIALFTLLVCSIPFLLPHCARLFYFDRVLMGRDGLVPCAVPAQP